MLSKESTIKKIVDLIHKSTFGEAKLSYSENRREIPIPFSKKCPMRAQNRVRERKHHTLSFKVKGKMYNKINTSPIPMPYIKRPIIIIAKLGPVDVIRAPTR